MRSCVEGEGGSSGPNGRMRNISTFFLLFGDELS